MATIGAFLFWRHLRADTNQFILRYRKGHLKRKGPGLAFWFNPLSAALAQVPIEDIETTMVLNERSSDFQDIAVQCTLTYRVTDPERAASRVNFTISSTYGNWVEQPLERLASYLSQRAQRPARAYLSTVPVVEAVQAGPVVVRDRIEEAMRSDEELAAMGIAIVSVQVNQIAPIPEVERAIQTPTREAIQQRADEAVFQRRAAAVEKERAIKENELATEIELARRQEQLIQMQGANKLRQVKEDAQADMAKTQAEIERARFGAESHSETVRIMAQGDAASRLLIAEATAEGESRRVEVYRNAPARVILGLALQQLAGNIQNIQHLNLTPDILGETFRQMLLDQAGK